ELPENLASWRDLSASADQCLGSKCAHYDRCFVFRMRRQAAEADLIVVNHHLFFADLALRSSSAGDAGAAVLPKYDAVVFDEAHALLERRCLTLGADLGLFSESQRHPDLIHWAESRGGHLFLHASPIDVAGLLQEKLYDRVGPVVFTSATLAVGGQLEYFAR